MPRTSKCESYCFFQAYTPYLWSGAFCVISFHLIFNVGGKSCCSSLEWSLASEFSNQNFLNSATRISRKCDQFTHAMSDFYDYCNPDSLYLIPNDGILFFFFFFFSKIFVETQDEVSIFTLLHTINNLFLLLPQFFHKIFVGGLVFGDDFLVLIRSHMGGGTHDGDGVRWGGLGKNDR